MRGGKRRIETISAGGDPADKTILNQIMLRFRPIAPRPVSVEGSVCSVPMKEKRAKRKYVRVKKKKNKKNKMKDDKGWSLEVCNGGEFVSDPVFSVRKIPDPEWISFNVFEHHHNTRWMTSDHLHDVDLSMSMTRRKLVESWITIESIIGTCEKGDEEIWKDLETDSCPGFISNGYDEVQWVNLAYRRMVDPDPENKGETNPPEVVVWLVVKVEKSTFAYWPAFSCRVRVVYDRLSDKKKQMTVPCDVWKMDTGGYAWRLDVKAALSLGRLS